MRQRIPVALYTWAIALSPSGDRLYVGTADRTVDVYDVAGWISPNPGGVGPMTRAMLLANIVEAAENAGR